MSVTAVVGTAFDSLRVDKKSGYVLRGDSSKLSRRRGRSEFSPEKSPLDTRYSNEEKDLLEKAASGIINTKKFSFWIGIAYDCLCGVKYSDLGSSQALMSGLNDAIRRSSMKKFKNVLDKVCPIFFLLLKRTGLVLVFRLSLFRF